MAEKANDHILYDTFPPRSKSEWINAIRKDLKGKGIEQLTRQTFEGFKVPPVFTLEDLDHIEWLDQLPGSFPFVRGTKTHSNNWAIRQDINASDPELANQKARAAIHSGTGEVGFRLSGIRSEPGSVFNILLRDIDISRISVVFQTDALSPEIIKAFARIIKERKLSVDQISGGFEYDPLSDLATGGLRPGKNLQTQVLDQLRLGAEMLPGCNLLQINGHLFSDLGTSVVHELAFSLALGVEYLSWISDSHLNFATTTNTLAFKMGIGPNFFMEIAKLRTLRFLWSKILSAYKMNHEKYSGIHIYSAPSTWNKTKSDPHVNMLRYTTEALSAALGGADSINISPFDEPLSGPSEFSERIARNTQILFKEESYLNRIADPGGGSYYIENLTNQLADEAWNIFLGIEQEGGYLKALSTGSIQKTILDLQQSRENSIANRKTILLGTNHYPNSHETLKPSKTFKEEEGDDSGPVIKKFRGAAKFESLREISGRQSKGRPRVFLFPFGNPVMRTVRVGFASNFFGCGGYMVENLTGIESTSEGLNRCNKEKPEVVVFCSSDEEYAQVLPGLLGKFSSNPLFIVAGHPEKDIENLENKGVRYFIHLKSNVLKTLQSVHNALGVK